MAVEPDQHADEFARDRLMVIVEALQVGNQLDVRRLETYRRAGRFHTALRFGAAKAQPFGRDAEPLRERAQLFLRWNSFTHQPFPCGMDGDGTAFKADIEFPSQLGWTVRRVFCVAECLLQSLAKAFSFNRWIHDRALFHVKP